MAENEDFMEAIREDMMAVQEEGGQDYGDEQRDMEDDYSEMDEELNQGARAPGNKITTQDDEIMGGKVLRGAAQQPPRHQHSADDDDYEDDD